MIAILCGLGVAACAVIAIVCLIAGDYDDYNNDPLN